MIDSKERDNDINLTIKFDLTNREHFCEILYVYGSNLLSISGGCYSDVNKLSAIRKIDK